MPENCVEKCVHRPRRVPGSRQAARRWCRTCAMSCGGAGTGAHGGASRRPAATSAATASPATPTARNDVVQPATCRRATSGIAAASWPPWPSRPVSWVTTGTRRGREPGGDEPQHAVKVIASPAPTRTRPRRGQPDGVRLGQDDLADPHDRRTRGDHAPGADPVEHRADRDLQAGVDGELQDDEEAEHGRRRAEALLRLGPGDPQRGAMEDRDAVGRDAQPPHQPGPA